MTDQLTPDPKRLDDELADFADQMLDGEDAEAVEMSAQNQELHELQNMVVRLKRAFGADEPDEGMARRIRANLVKAWQEDSTTAEADRESLRQGWWRNLGFPRLARRQVYAFSILIAILFAGVLVIVFSPDTSSGGTLPGAAGGQAGLLPVVVLAGIALAGVVWWVVRRRDS